MPRPLDLTRRRAQKPQPEAATQENVATLGCTARVQSDRALNRVVSFRIVVEKVASQHVPVSRLCN